MLNQTKIYVGKCFRMFVTKKQYKNLISAAMIILLISIVTGNEMFTSYKDTKNGCFAIISACVWIGLFNSIQAICSERAIIKKEHHSGLHISSYVLAHVVYDFCLCLSETLFVFTVVLIRNAGHLPEAPVILSKYTELYLTFFLVTFSSDVLAILISSIVRSTSTAMTVMPFVLIIQLVMSGAVFELEGVTKYISYLTITKWGLDSLITISNTNAKVHLEYLRASGEMCEPEPSTLLLQWGLLIMFIAVYIILSIVFLHSVDKDER